MIHSDDLSIILTSISKEKVEIELFLVEKGRIRVRIQFILDGWNSFGLESPVRIRLRCCMDRFFFLVQPENFPIILTSISKAKVESKLFLVGKRSDPCPVFSFNGLNSFVRNVRI